MVSVSVTTLIMSKPPIDSGSVCLAEETYSPTTTEELLVEKLTPWPPYWLPTILPYEPSEPRYLVL